MLQQTPIRAHPEYAMFVNQVLALLGPNKRVADVKFRQLWDIILHVTPGLSDFTLFIDGLDECDDSDEMSQTQMISELINLSTKANAQVVVLFRHHPHLEAAFRDCPTIEITPTIISNDIQLYVSAEIQRHPKQLLRLEKKILRTILASCQGMFLWAEMMLRCLKSAETYNEQLMYLENPPPDLYDFYDEIISSTTTQLNPASLNRRREILVILVGIYTALPCEELSYILSLRVGVIPRVEELNELIESEKTVIRLCWPLVRVSKNQVHLIHGTVKDYLTRPVPDTNPHLHITSDESNTYLASKCLAALSQEQYRSINKIAILIRRNVASTTEEEDDKYFYQYAATHWFVHLIAVQKPEIELVQQAATFIVRNEFVSWSEFIFQLSGSQGMALEVESKLSIWREGLSKELQDVLILDRYFSGPYRAAADAFEEDGGDKTLSYLCLFQLGEYYNLATRIEEAFEIKQIVARGLIDLLGERHPLSLMAESAFALEYLGQRRFPEAEETFRRLAQIQREVLGDDRPDSFQSLQRQGMAELWMTKFADADLCLTKSLSGFIKTVGVTSFLYLMSQLTLGQVLEYQGEVRRAFLDYEHIWRYRSSILGADNPMAVWARCAMVSAYRKLGLYGEAEKAVLQVIDARTRTIGPKVSSTVDAIIQRVVLYLDMERDTEALELIEFLLDGGLVDQWFERDIQVNHVRALLELFASKIELAIEILQSLVDRSIEKGAEGRVRSMLWVRIDLAAILRRNGRGDEAPMLFDELVTSIDHDSSSSWEEPQTPIELALAEEALILVRDMKFYDADALLKENGLQWLRQEDFWILNGSPPADTAWMKRPYPEVVQEDIRSRRPLEVTRTTRISICRSKCQKSPEERLQ
jgi:tetratricopeptide (TPR) repeat protein